MHLRVNRCGMNHTQPSGELTAEAPPLLPSLPEQPPPPQQLASHLGSALDEQPRCSRQTIRKPGLCMIAINRSIDRPTRHARRNRPDAPFGGWYLEAKQSKAKQRRAEACIDWTTGRLASHRPPPGRRDLTGRAYVGAATPSSSEGDGWPRDLWPVRAEKREPKYPQSGFCPAPLACIRDLRAPACRVARPHPRSRAIQLLERDSLGERESGR